jgi:hypothetical protein
MLDKNSQFLESAYSNLFKSAGMSKYLSIGRYFKFVSNRQSVNIYCFFIGAMVTWIFFSFLNEGVTKSSTTNEELSFYLFATFMFLLLSGLFALLNSMVLDGMFCSIQKSPAVTSEELAKTLKLVLSDLEKGQEIDYRLYNNFVIQMTGATNKISVPQNDPNYLSIESSKLKIGDLIESSSRLLADNKEN